MEGPGRYLTVGDFEDDVDTLLFNVAEPSGYEPLDGAFDVGADTVLTLGGGDFLLVVGVSAADLVDDVSVGSLFGDPPPFPG